MARQARANARPSSHTRAVTAVAAALALAAGAARPSAGGTASAVPSRPDDRAIVHVLNRLGFGPRPGDVERVRSMGLEAYIDLQLHPERIPDPDMERHLSGLPTLGMSSQDLAERYFKPAAMERRARQLEARQAGGAGDAPASPRMSETMIQARSVLVELGEQKVLRAVYSERQLEEVLTDFWFNHFNVFAGKGLTREYLTDYEQRTIRPRVLGKFRDLLGAVAKSPAMLFYLDNWLSADPKAADRMAEARRQAALRGRRPGFGFRPPQAPARPPRELGLNENYARELMELHTLGVDGGYTQQDVIEVARAFTGWTIAGPRDGGGFRFDPRRHDPGPKLVLGHRIDAGGQQDGEQVLDLLASRPATARFIAGELARRFVADEPPPALVERAAKRFLETGGDIREVVRTIVTSPEFFAADAYRSKAKTPFELVVSALRVTGADVADARAAVQQVAALGMPLYGAQPPTGYPDRADRWVNAGALVARMNFAVALAADRLPGVRVDAAAIAGARPPFADRAAAAIVAGDVSGATRAALDAGRTPAEVVALALGSPEFQRR